MGANSVSMDRWDRERERFGHYERHGHEVTSPLDSEIKYTVLEMQQELAYIDTLPEFENLRHSRRLLREECNKLEGTIDPDWVEVDNSKPIKITKRILVPTHRNPNYNYAGRILGPKGQTLKNIGKKFKCHISVMGANSTKDRTKELELLNSGDPQHAHYASPMHVRIDTVAPAHIAHCRIAAAMNVFSKLLIPGRDTIPGITDYIVKDSRSDGKDQKDSSVKIEVSKSKDQIPSSSNDESLELQQHLSFGDDFDSSGRHADHGSHRGEYSSRGNRGGGREGNYTSSKGRSSNH